MKKITRVIVSIISFSQLSRSSVNLHETLSGEGFFQMSTPLFPGDIQFGSLWSGLTKKNSTHYIFFITNRSDSQLSRSSINLYETLYGERFFQMSIPLFRGVFSNEHTTFPCDLQFGPFRSGLTKKNGMLL